MPNVTVSSPQGPYRAKEFLAIGLVINETPFHPFFWLSSFIVAPSAVAMRDGAALRGRHLSFPYSFVLKNVMSSYLNWTVCFVLLHVPFIVYSPMRRR